MSAIAQAADKLRLWREKPQVFVREVFGVTPDAWQDDVLEAFPASQRQAMKACKGPGKTTVLAWLNWNFLLTRPHPKMAATSITGDNLADGLWAEMAKWQKCSPLLTEAFDWQKTRIVLKEHPETWFLSARSWPRGGSNEQQADTLASLAEMAVANDNQYRRTLFPDRDSKPLMFRHHLCITPLRHSTLE